jgi:hypothetical protein
VCNTIGVPKDELKVVKSSIASCLCDGSPYRQPWRLRAEQHINGGGGSLSKVEVCRIYMGVIQAGAGYAGIGLYRKPQ